MEHRFHLIYYITKRSQGTYKFKYLSQHLFIILKHHPRKNIVLNHLTIEWLSSVEGGGVKEATSTATLTDLKHFYDIERTCCLGGR